MTPKVAKMLFCITGASLLAFANTGVAYAMPASHPSVAKSTENTTVLPLDLTGDAIASEERDRIQKLLLPLKTYDGGMSWDSVTKTVTVRMTSSDALKDARIILGNAKTWLQFRFEQVEYSADELSDLADKLLSNQASWAGATGIGGGFDPAQNRVLLQVDAGYCDAGTLIKSIKNLKDSRTVLEILDPIKGWAPESRMADSPPWTAGAAINSSTGGCTLGWTWKLWGSGQIVSSTARHCANLTWTNNGQYVGTVFQSHPAGDSAFLRGSSYSPTIFVGSTNTSEIRQVVGLDTSWNVGDQVAMSGRTTGLNVTTVKMPTYTLPSCAGEHSGLTGVLMQSHVTAPGDSGGPWLTTRSDNGNVVAHGQHFGRGCASGYSGSFFVKLNTISAAQHASILLR